MERERRGPICHEREKKLDTDIWVPLAIIKVGAKI
jgi:hypothetical protein